MTRDTSRAFFVDRRIPVALLFTLFIQMGGIVWWASTTQAQDTYHDVRLHELETRRITDVERQEHILERLTRLEARSEAQLEILQRLDRKK
jgi:hypothetical protein